MTPRMGLELCEAGLFLYRCHLYKVPFAAKLTADGGLLTTDRRQLTTDY